MILAASISPALATGLLGVIAVATALSLYRVFLGPHLLDRVLCLDLLAVLVVCMAAVWGLYTGTAFFFDAILVLTITGFISMVAFAKYLEDGDIVD